MDRQEYLKCAQIRKQRCPLFADKPINIAEAGQRLPETGVPRGIEQGAVQMESVQYFSPTLSGPATHGTPFRAQENPDEADEAELDPDDGARKEENADARCTTAPDALIADENANAEFLIGLDGISSPIMCSCSCASFVASFALAIDKSQRRDIVKLLVHVNIIHMH